MSDEIKAENGLEFKLSADKCKLLAVFIPCTDKIELTATIFKERLADTPFAKFFLDDHLVVEFLHRCKDASGKEGFECEVGEKRDASCEIRVSESHLTAYLSITPNFGGKEVTLEDIQKLLIDKKIVWGIAPIDEIEALLKKDHVSNFLVAQGLEAEAGIDAKFVSMIPEAQERKPLVDENGDVDYRELGDLVIVHKDDSLMQRIPPVQGKKGRNILGEEILPTGGANTPFSGDKKGVRINPQDSNQLVANITGQPVLVPNGIIVMPVLTVKKVDFSSGNIRFDGSIVVLGDVAEGMKLYALEDITIEGSVTDSLIECMGSINIKGSVTGSSELVANGDVNIKGGVQGHQETKKNADDDDVLCSKIISHGSVILGFAENFSVEAGVDIIIEKYALNCQLMAGNKIVAGAKNGGKKSSLMGGVAWAMTLIKGTIIGASSGIKTQIQVGSNPYIQKRIQSLKLLLEPNEKEQKDIRQILTFIDSHPERGNVEMLEKLHHTLSKSVINAEMYQSELKELTENMTTISDAKIIAERGVYTGTEIRINNVLWKAQENRGKSVFRVESREMTVNTR